MTKFPLELPSDRFENDCVHFFHDLSGLLGRDTDLFLDVCGEVSELINSHENDKYFILERLVLIDVKTQ